MSRRQSRRSPPPGRGAPSPPPSVEEPRPAAESQVVGRAAYKRLLLPPSSEPRPRPLPCCPGAHSPARLVAAVDAFVRDWLARNYSLIEEAGLTGKPINVRINVGNVSLEELQQQWSASRLPVTLLISPNLPAHRELAVLRVSPDTDHESNADTVSLVGTWRGTSESFPFEACLAIEFSTSGIRVQDNGSTFYWLG